MIAPTSTAQLITRQNLDQRKELARQQLQDLYQQQQVQQQELDNRVANTPIGGINQALQGMVNALTAPERRRQEQANLDARNALLAEQQAYERSRDERDFDATQQYRQQELSLREASNRANAQRQSQQDNQLRNVQLVTQPDGSVVYVGYNPTTNSSEIIPTDATRRNGGNGGRGGNTKLSGAEAMDELEQWQVDNPDATRNDFDLKLADMNIDADVRNVLGGRGALTDQYETATDLFYRDNNINSVTDKKVLDNSQKRFNDIEGTYGKTVTGAMIDQFSNATDNPMFGSPEQQVYRNDKEANAAIDGLVDSLQFTAGDQTYSYDQLKAEYDKNIEAGESGSFDDYLQAVGATPTFGGN
ncbi:hypothetical protein JCM19239_5303 [Vibrio variabilis]|uniref:Uncharacterized protein n=1 Tax=Vibrio variabilis TaxID=990271 RepID=A0ABQ0JNP5_9VIBR|nr:hypothetical protein JCM19239_5303 [Vibrio variabilis]